VQQQEEDVSEGWRFGVMVEKGEKKNMEGGSPKIWGGNRGEVPGEEREKWEEGSIFAYLADFPLIGAKRPLEQGGGGQMLCGVPGNHRQRKAPLPDRRHENAEGHRTEKKIKTSFLTEGKKGEASTYVSVQVVKILGRRDSIKVTNFVTVLKGVSQIPRGDSRVQRNQKKDQTDVQVGQRELGVDWAYSGTRATETKRKREKELSLRIDGGVPLLGGQKLEVNHERTVLFNKKEGKRVVERGESSGRL